MNQVVDQVVGGVQQQVDNTGQQVQGTVDTTTGTVTNTVTGVTKTSLPGVIFGDTMAQLARLAHKLTVVRSFQTNNAEHNIVPLVSADSLNATVGALYSRAAGSAIRPDLTAFGAYGACKEAIRTMSRAAACEWGRDGIRVNVVLPLALSPSMARVRSRLASRRSGPGGPRSRSGSRRARRGAGAAASSWPRRGPRPSGSGRGRSRWRALRGSCGGGSRRAGQGQHCEHRNRNVFTMCPPPD